jgi:hypothetical protein
MPQSDMQAVNPDVTQANPATSALALPPGVNGDASKESSLVQSSILNSLSTVEIAALLNKLASTQAASILPVAPVVLHNIGNTGITQVLTPHVQSTDVQLRAGRDQGALRNTDVSRRPAAQRKQSPPPGSSMPECPPGHVACELFCLFSLCAF